MRYINTLVAIALILFLQGCDNDASTANEEKEEVIAQLGSETKIKSLVLSMQEGDQIVVFDADLKATVIYPYNPIPLTKVRIRQMRLSFGATSSYSTEIEVIDNKASIVVTAQNGTSKQTYSISFKMVANTQANLTRLVLTLAGVDRAVDFSASRQATIKYTYSSNDLTSVTVKSISISTDATSDYANGETIAIVDGKVTITVTAQDGSTKTYTILFVGNYKTLRHILDSSLGGATKVPTDLSSYDQVTRTVLSNYTTGAELEARYVSISGAGEQNGLSWANAAPANQLKPVLDGITDASAEKVYLLLVASGSTSSQVYDAGSSEMRLKRNVAIIGGWDASGDWGRSGSTILSGGDSHIIFVNFGAHIDSKAILYGVTIADGKNPYPNAYGGAIYNLNSSPNFINVTFSGNSADRGGGIYNVNSSLTLTNVTFTGNVAQSKGGAIYNENSSPIMTNVTFVDNTADEGGAMYNQSSSPIITNSIIWDNAGEQIVNDSASSPTIAYSLVFWSNSTRHFQLRQFVVDWRSITITGV